MHVITTLTRWNEIQYHHARKSQVFGNVVVYEWVADPADATTFPNHRAAQVRADAILRTNPDLKLLIVNSEEHP